MRTVLVINPCSPDGEPQVIANLGVFPNNVETEVEEGRISDYEAMYQPFPESGKLVVDLRGVESEPAPAPVDEQLVFPEAPPVVLSSNETPVDGDNTKEGE